MYVSMTAAGMRRIKARSSRLKFRAKACPSRFLLSGLNNAAITAAPKLKAAASPNIRAGSSKMP